MSTQTTNYQCPSCTGPLQFDAASGKLKCEYCDGSFDAAEIEQLYARKNEAAAENFDSTQKLSADKSQNHWDTSHLSDNWQGDDKKLKAYTCPSCAAQLICDETTAATQCPYCGNPTVVPGQFSGDLKPDYIIPFKVTADTAKDKLRKFYEGKKFLPKGFAEENSIEKLQGVYVPFWLFDCKLDIDALFDGTLVTSHQEGRYKITTTSHYDLHRKGRFTFTDIPVDASEKMPDKYMNAIEPFNLSGLKPFSMSYLPGYLAERYGISPQDSFAAAENRAENTAMNTLYKDIAGYGGGTVKSKKLSFERGKVKYALLPVYMLTTKYKGQEYVFAVNGQTGKFVGNLPVSKAKSRAAFCGITAAVTAVLGTLLMFIL